MKALLFLVILLSSCQSDGLRTYRLIDPSNAGEQFIAVTDSTIYYYGKVQSIKLPDQPYQGDVHFLSRSIATRSHTGGLYWMMRDFQFSPTNLRIEDWSSQNANASGSGVSWEIYNSFAGELIGDTVQLGATKHLYDSRSDQLLFVRIK